MFTPEQRKALDEMMLKEQPRIDRGAAKVKEARRRDEEMFQRHTKVYLDMNFSHVDEHGIRQYQFPYWAVRNEISVPPTGVDPAEWAMRQGRRAKDMGVRAGVTDWHMLYYGKYHVIELKVPGGSVSKSQKLFMLNITEHGGEAHVAWNMDEFHVIISSFASVLYDPAACDSRSKKLMTQQAAAQELWNNDDND